MFCAVTSTCDVGIAGGVNWQSSANLLFFNTEDGGLLKRALYIGKDSVVLERYG